MNETQLSEKYIIDYFENTERQQANSKKIVEVEGSESTLDQFIRINIVDADVLPIIEEEIKSAELLEIGESCFIGMCEIKRLK